VLGRVWLALDVDLCARLTATMEQGSRAAGGGTDFEGARLVLREERVKVGGGDVAGSACPLVPESKVNIVVREMRAAS
jgi:hypothetical protein